MSAPNQTALVEVEPRARPRGRPQTRRRQRAPVVRRRTQRSRCTVIWLDWIRRAAAAALLNDRSFTIFSDSVMTAAAAAIRNRSFAVWSEMTALHQVVKTGGPVVELVVELASTLNTCDRLGSSLNIRDACGDWGEEDAFELRSELFWGLL